MRWIGRLREWIFTRRNWLFNQLPQLTFPRSDSDSTPWHVVNPQSTSIELVNQRFSLHRNDSEPTLGLTFVARTVHGANPIRAIVWKSHPFFRTRHQRTVFRHAAFAEATRHAAQLRTDHHPARERLPEERGDEGPRCECGRGGWIVEHDDPRHACVHYRLSSHAGRLSSTVAGASAPDSPRTRCPTAESRIVIVCYASQTRRRQIRAMARREPAPAHQPVLQSLWLRSERAFGIRTNGKTWSLSLRVCGAQSANSM
jgi:hypothetical protein